MEKPLSSRIELITFPGTVFTPGVASGRGVFHCQTCLPCCCHPVTVLPSTGLPSLTMKATFSAALLVLAISAWTSFAVGKLQVLALSTFSAIDLTYGKISGASAM